MQQPNHPDHALYSSARDAVATLERGLGRDYDDNSENKGRPLRVTCRLETEPARRADVFGICEFD